MPSAALVVSWLSCRQPSVDGVIFVSFSTNEGGPRRGDTSVELGLASPRPDLVDPWQASSPSGLGRSRSGIGRRGGDAGEGCPPPLVGVVTWTARTSPSPGFG
ncbi:hypothetical protein NL676_037300 [Syzygium grande]|nr:hypothetical protein NL676_037300 [Syzygium grande]